MENKFFSALSTNDEFTENGMPTHSSSGNAVLDLFYKMGGARTMGESELLDIFSRALNENPILAIKAMFYNRDVRGGQGERKSFRIMFKYICEKYPVLTDLVYKFVPEYGRWDDLLVGLDSPIDEKIVSLIQGALNFKNILARKWMPRENKSQKELALKLMKAMELTPRQYRKLIAIKDNEVVVENLMCKNKWDKINYNQIPSIASKNYRNAFKKHDEERYSEWLSALEKGSPDVKINAGAIFPHDIVKQYFHNYGDINRTLEAQWKALPDYIENGLKFIPVVDVSGSMSGEPIEVALALGIYLSERNKSVFKDGFITFSHAPKLQILTGSLRDRVNQLFRAQWDMNTNLEAVFDLILQSALREKLTQEDMPNYIVILSDMQFDQGVTHASHNVMDMIKEQYNNVGYIVPQVVFWNLRTSQGVPVKFNEEGVALVSGFSPSLMKSLLGGKLNPLSMMLSVLDSERYQPIQEALEKVL